MRREISLTKATEIDDLAYPGGQRCETERPGGHPILLGERAARAHRMDEVVGGVDAFESGRDRLGLEDVPLHDLRRRGDARLHVLGPPGDAADTLSTCFERVQQSAADIAGGTGQEDQTLNCDESSLDVLSDLVQPRPEVGVGGPSKGRNAQRGISRPPRAAACARDSQNGAGRSAASSAARRADSAEPVNHASMRAADERIS